MTAKTTLSQDRTVVYHTYDLEKSSVSHNNIHHSHASFFEISAWCRDGGLPDLEGIRDLIYKVNNCQTCIRNYWDAHPQEVSEHFFGREFQQDQEILNLLNAQYIQQSNTKQNSK